MSLILNPMNLSASKDVNMAFQGYVEDETKKILNSKLSFPWRVYKLTPSNFTQYHITSSNLPFTKENTKKTPAKKKTTENLRKHSITWRSLFGEFSWASRNLQLYFEIILSISRLVISRRLWFLCGKNIDEENASKTEKEYDRGNVVSKKEEKCRSIPAKPTGNKKDIPGLSKD